MLTTSTRDSYGIASALKAGQPFTTHGALSGRPTWGGMDYNEFGHLPAPEWNSAQESTYAVFSYSTPIAWRLPSGDWVQPEVKYSVTTTHHQSKIAFAIHLARQWSPDE